MREPERLEDGIVSTTDDARQAVTGHNANVVLIASLVLAATAGVALLGYFWKNSLWIAS